MTTLARDALAREVDRLAAEVTSCATSARDDSETDDIGHYLLEPWIASAVRRLDRLRGVLEAAVIVDDPARAVIGRRVTVRETDGVERTYGLAAPGGGDPSRGLVSIDSPFGAALMNRWAGQAADVLAPSGSRRIAVIAIN